MEQIVKVKPRLEVRRIEKSTPTFGKRWVVHSTHPTKICQPGIFSQIWKVENWNQQLDNDEDDDDDDHDHDDDDDDDDNDGWLFFN